jgi:hypothetical protein
MFTRDQEYAKALEWCKGNRAAADFLMMGFEMTQIADDFVDRDVPDHQIDSGRMLRMLHLCMVDIPSNDFYRFNQAWFTPILSTSFLIWDATNHWAGHPSQDTRMFAYTWREICEQIVFMAARLIGGLDHARRVVRDVHEFYHYYHQGDENFHQWEKKEANHE